MKKVFVVLLAALVLFTSMPAAFMDYVYAEEYRLYLFPNNGTMEENVVIEHSGSVILPDCPEQWTVPEGARFKCWDYEEMGDYYYPGEERSFPDEACFYAVWEYKVTFYPNNGTDEDPMTIIVDPGNTIGLPDRPDMWTAPEGKTFLGWSEQASNQYFARKPGDSFTYYGDNNCLYAVWGYSFTFASPKENGGYTYMGDTRWHVIGENDDKLLFISSEVLGESVTWSDRESTLSDIFLSFSDAEKESIMTTYKTEITYPDYPLTDINGEKLFLLSALEMDGDYSFAKSPGNWWLRTPYNPPERGAYAVIERTSQGTTYTTVDRQDPSTVLGVRPAFHLDKSAVLYGARTNGEATWYDESFGSFGKLNDYNYWNDDFKLTLIDSSRDWGVGELGGYSFSAVIYDTETGNIRFLDDGLQAKSGETITLHYATPYTGQNDRITALICDGSGKAIYYASMIPEASAPEGYAYGDWDLTLPYIEGTYTLKVFNEQISGINQVNYASHPITAPLEMYEEKGLNISYFYFSNGDSEARYDGKPVSLLSVSVQYGKNDPIYLTEGVDYTAEITGESVEAGPVEITATGLGQYEGLTAVAYGWIYPSSIKDVISGIIAESEYTGFPQEPSFSFINKANEILEINPRNYICSPASIQTNAGSYGYVQLTGQNSLYGTDGANWTIKPADFNSENINVTLSPEAYRFGEAEVYEPDVTITLTSDQGVYTLIPGTDYTVDYSNNNQAGTGKVTITPAGSNFAGGPIEKTFAIRGGSSTQITTEDGEQIEVYISADEGVDLANIDTTAVIERMLVNGTLEVTDGKAEVYFEIVSQPRFGEESFVGYTADLFAISGGETVVHSDEISDGAEFTFSLDVAIPEEDFYPGQRVRLSYGSDETQESFALIKYAEVSSDEKIQITTGLLGDEHPIIVTKGEYLEEELATVYFNADGWMPYHDIQVIVKGEKVTEPEPPAMDGRVFLGWTCWEYDQEWNLKGRILYDFDMPVTGDIWLEARWAEEGYTEPAKVKTVDVLSSEDEPVRVTVRAAEGIDIEDIDVSAVIYRMIAEDKLVISGGEAEVILSVYAVGTNGDGPKGDYSLVYLAAASGSNEMVIDEDEISEGAEFTFELDVKYASPAGGLVEIAEQTGYVEEELGSHAVYSPIQYSVVPESRMVKVTSGSRRIRATSSLYIDEELAAVYFDTDGGNAVEPQVFVSGGKASEPEAPSKEGYAFDGWSLNGEPFNFDDPVTETITLKAEWAETAHISLTATEAKAATCEEEGNIAYWTCDTCGKIFSDADAATEITIADTVVPATGHVQLVKTDAAAPTCSAEGNIEYWTCEACGKTFSDEAGTIEIGKADTMIAADPDAHDWNDWTVIKEAACTEDGYKYRTCKNNQIHIQMEAVQATGHDLSHVDAKPATEDETGNIEYWICSACEKYFSDAEGKTEISFEETVIPAAGHTLVKTAAVAATCETAGNIEYWICTDCGKLFGDAAGTVVITNESTVVPALGHKWDGGSVTKEPTCTEAGVKTYTCINDPAHTKTETIPASGHDLTHVAAKEATCSAEGNIEYWTCSVCGKLFSDADAATEITITDTVVPATDHVQLTKTNAAAPTCSAEGNIEYWTCTDCGKLFSDSEAKNEISEADTVIAADPDAHDWNDWTVVKEASCVETGYRYRTCKTNSVHIQMETIPVTGHNVMHFDAEAATCSAVGNSEYWFCGDCERFFSDAGAVTEITAEDIAVPMTGHLHLKEVAAAAATCETAGNIGYWTCTDCGKFFADEAAKTEISEADTVTAIDSSAHDWNDWIVIKAATCSEEGFRYRTCKHNSVHIQMETIPPAAHDLIHVDAVEATDDSAGNVEYWFCEDCGKYFSDAEGKTEISVEETVIPAAGHTLVRTAAVAATCETAGNIEYWTCTDCGKLFGDAAGTVVITNESTVVPALGHKWDEGRVTKEPTCTEPGVKTYTCTNDPAHTKTETIPAKGHDLTHVAAKEATCAAEGNIEYWTCSACGKYFSDAAGTKEIAQGDTVTPVDKTKHVWDEGVVTTPATHEAEGVKTFTCTVCGDTKTEIIPKLDGEPENEIIRLAGASRYDTGISAADHLKEKKGISAFGNIIIASGADFPDALSASYLAYVKGAPVLLVGKDAASIAKVTSYVNNNLASGGTVYIVGGPGAVNESVESAVSGKVRRLAGSNRYGTNIAVLKEAGMSGGDLLVASGMGYADALSASAAGRPILLVGTALTVDQKEFLAANKSAFTGTTYIIGGAGAVSDPVKTAVEAYTGASKRLAGGNRYDTSRLVAETFFTGEIDTMVIASGKGFPDGLSGGPVALSYGAPLVLVADGNADHAVKIFKDKKAHTLIVMGGFGAVSKETAEAIAAPAKETE